MTGALHSFAMTLSLQTLGVQNSAVWRMSSLYTNAVFFLLPADGSGVVRGDGLS